MGALDAKAILITGAGRGIGAACARMAAALGAGVLIADVDSDAADAVAAEIAAAGGRAAAAVGDITVWDAAERLVAACVDRFGAIDGLVNNAGRLRAGPLQEETEDGIRQMVEANVTGTLFCTVHALRRMRAQGRGAIVNITSGAQAGIAGLATYSATKGAVASLTYACAIEQAPAGIRVNAVSPIAETRMTGTMQAYLASIGQAPPTRKQHPPELNAPVVCYLLSDAAAAVTGQVVRLSGEELSLMTHPAIQGPVLRRDHWSLEAIATAFTEQLAGRQLPLGLTVLPAR